MIEPALTAKQWGFHPGVCEAFDRYGFAAAIAIANHLLDPDDPRKITRAKIDAMREVIAEEWPTDLPGIPNASLVVQFADALASYLPPEP